MVTRATAVHRAVAALLLFMAGCGRPASSSQPQRRHPDQPNFQVQAQMQDVTGRQFTLYLDTRSQSVRPHLVFSLSTYPHDVSKFDARPFFEKIRQKELREVFQPIPALPADNPFVSP